MLCAHYSKACFDTAFLLCEAASFAGETADAFAQLAAQAINIVDGHLGEIHRAEEYFVHDRNDPVAFFDLLFDPVIHAALREMLFDGSNVLPVPISEERESALARWQAQARRQFLVELVAGVIVPFPDDKTNDELAMSFHAEVGVRVADFTRLAEARCAARFFFLT